MENTFLYGMLDKKEKPQRIQEKKILNAKIFEYHKDMDHKSNNSTSFKEEIKQSLANINQSEVASQNPKEILSLKELFDRDISKVENKVFRIKQVQENQDKSKDEVDPNNPDIYNYV